MISGIFAFFTLIVIVILALFGIPGRNKYADMSASYMADLESGTATQASSTPADEATSAPIIPQIVSRRPRRRDKPATDAATDDTGKRVKFNMYNTERKFGKKSGTTISTAVVKAAAA